MIMTRTLGVVCFLSLALSTDAALAACAGGRALILANQTVDRVMTVRGGKSCAIRLSGSLGPTYGAEIVERPQHGTVAVQVPHRVVYTARAGYVGNDSFAYARKGLSTQNAPVTFSVRVAVRVVR
jgi:hypothetical protein